MASGVAEPPRRDRVLPPPPPDVPDEPFDRGRGDDDADRPGVRWVTLATFLYPAEAHIARLKLEDAGVLCVLLDEMTAATQCLSLVVGGVKLQVPEQEAERAVALLRRLMPSVVPPLAVYATREVATMAACVAEAAGFGVSVRPLGRTWAVRDEGQTAGCARAIADSPFAGGLTGLGLDALSAQPCPACGEIGSRIDWKPPRRAASWKGVGRLRAAVARLLARRRCRCCGCRW